MSHDILIYRDNISSATICGLQKTELPSSFEGQRPARSSSCDLRSYLLLSLLLLLPAKTLPRVGVIDGWTLHDGFLINIYIPESRVVAVLVGFVLYRKSCVHFGTVPSGGARALVPFRVAAMAVMAAVQLWKVVGVALEPVLPPGATKVQVRIFRVWGPPGVLAFVLVATASRGLKCRVSASQVLSTWRSAGV